MTASWVRGTTYWTTLYKRKWRSTLFSSFLQPLLLLAAVGKGLGSLVDANGTVAGVDYVTFLAPGLLAASTLSVLAQEAMWPVSGAVRWNRAYVALVTTPLGPRDAMWGHVAYMALRGLMVASLFVIVMGGFGAIESAWVVLAIPAAVLGGLAMAVPISAYAVQLTIDSGFAGLNRFVIIPMTLFAGAYFPVTQLPAAIRPVAYATPMWHSVDLCRGLALGNAGLARSAGHVAFLIAVVAGGAVVSARFYRRVLTP